MDKINFIARPAPIYMLGDSQCLIFNHLLFEAHYNQEKYYLMTQARYCPGLAASNFLDQRERLHDTVLRALLSECLIDTENRALYQFQGPHSSIITLLAGRIPQAPILVLFCGGSDLVNVFLRYLGESNDFYLPEQENLLRAFKPIENVQIFPYQMARDYVLRLFSPLAQGIRKLKGMGFDQLFLHNIAPQTLDDGDFKRVRLYTCPAYIRYKSLLLFNQMLKELAESEGIGFIDIWDEVTIDNQLDPRFYLDSIHLNKQAAFITMDKLWQQLTQAAHFHFISDEHELQKLYEDISELSIRLSHSALNFKYAEVLTIYQQNQTILKRVREHQQEFVNKIPFVISGLYYIAQAYYTLRQYTPLYDFIRENLSLFNEYKGMRWPGQAQAKTPAKDTKNWAVCLVDPEQSIGKLPKELNYPVLLASEASQSIEISLWQKQYPNLEFRSCPISTKNIPEFRDFLLTAEVCFVPQSLPQSYRDLIIFALIEEIKVSLMQ